MEEIFKNDIVISTLLRVAPVQDLLKLRLLQRKYNHLACNALNIISPRTRLLSTGEEVERLVTTFESRDPSTLPPFTAFDMETWEIPLAQIQRFVEILGSGVRRYRLRFQENPTYFAPSPRDLDHNHVKEKITALLSNCQRLESLDLLDADLVLNHPLELPDGFPKLHTLISHGFKNFKEEERDLTLYVARHAPALEEVKLIGNLQLQEQVPYLALVPQFLCHECLNTPKLTLHTAFTDQESSDFLDAMIDIGYKRVRSLQFTTVEVKSYFLTRLFKFLDLNSETLEDLSIHLILVDNEHNLSFSLPALKKLQTLSLDLIFDSNINNPVKLQPFQNNQFPNLRTLKFEAYRQNRWFGEGVLAPNLHSLTIREYNGSAENESMHLNFPRLKVLRVSRYDSVTLLEYTLSEMTGLEELRLGLCRNIFPSFVSWRIFTGGASREYGQLTNKIGGTLSPRKLEPVPSLGNLKALKRLELDIRSTVELEALCFMSRSGQLPRLEMLSMNFDPPGSRSWKMRSKEENIQAGLLEILKKCHKMVIFQNVDPY